MKFTIILFIFAVLIAKCFSANDGNCVINDDGISWKNNIYINSLIKDSEGLNKIFDFEGALEVTNVYPGQYGSFITVIADQEKKQLIFKTNKDFDNFDESVPKQNTDEVTSVVTVTFTCKDGSTFLRFVVNIQDTNNHAPTFSQSSYTYNIPMPLAPTIDLTSFGYQIIATDIDFSNQNVTFTIDPPGNFELTTISAPTNKDYQAVLSVSAFTWLAEKTTFTITARDSGNPPLQSSVTLTITPDKTNSCLPDVPKFSAPVYRFYYTVNNEGNPTLTPSTSDPIAITTTNPETTTVELEANDYLTASFDQSTKEVIIRIVEPMDIISEHVVVLTLTVTLNNNANYSSQTIILVDLPNDNCRNNNGNTYFTYINNMYVNSQR